MKYKNIKYFLDQLLSLILLPLLLPIILFLAFISFVLYQENPFFLQERIGKNENPFIIYKLKTLFCNRLTGWGKFLRKYSLDELPQVLNVLKGEMSFIGPRPLPPEYLQVYTPTEKLRHQVKPGITGLAQIKGRNALAWEHKFRYDVFYVRKISWKLDKYILKETLKIWFSPSGIDARPDITGGVNLLELRQKEK